MSVQIKGQKELEKQLKKFSNPNKTFDTEVKKAALNALHDIIERTPKKRRSVVERWGSTVRKISNSVYRISNDAMTPNGKYSLVEILDKGRKTVYPKNKYLYIPLNDKGFAKKAGEKPKSDLVFGKDYVLARKSKATKKLDFIKKNEGYAQGQMVKLVTRKIGQL
jgi:hypothetical protein